MSETYTIVREDIVKPQEPLGKRVGKEGLYCRLCGDCIARTKIFLGSYGAFQAEVDSSSGDLKAMAEVQCTSMLNGGREHANLKHAFTFTEGAIEDAFRLMNKLEAQLPCKQYPDFFDSYSTTNNEEIKITE